QRLAALLERQPPGEWVYDAPSAALAYGKLRFEAPLIGTHTPTDSWLWAWSNKNVKLTLTNRALGDTARSLAHRLNVHHLGAPAVALEPVLGPTLLPSAAHVLGAVLSGELGYDAFHTTPHDSRREPVLIRDGRLRAAVKRPL